MDDTAQKILTGKHMGVLVFDRTFKILDVDGQAKRLLALAGADAWEDGLLAVFPELIGSETFIQDVMTGKSVDFRLDFVNRDAPAGTVFFNLLIVPGSPSGNGVLVIEDISAHAGALQELHQFKYEGLLQNRRSALGKPSISPTLLGDSPAINRIRETIRKLSTVPKATVLILGESGTGKSLAAQAIHDGSMSGEAPFVDINCAALPENLIESELFGYAKGAFTHATGSRTGLLEEASGGTVLLEEIGEMPLSMQAKLLTVLETKKFRRLGSNKTIMLASRIIAATNRNLAHEIQENRFREDLFYRLNVVSITMPPLRAMPSDIPLIAGHMIKVFNREFKKKVEGFDADAEKALIGHSWPGNVRELSNCIERAMIFVETQRITRKDLLIAESGHGKPAAEWAVPEEGVDLEAVERALIVSALDRAGGNKSKASRLLGLTRDTLRYRLEKHRL